MPKWLGAWGSEVVGAGPAGRGAGSMGEVQGEVQAFWRKARDVGLFRRAEIGPPGSIYATPTIGQAFLDAHWDELMSGD